MTVSPPPPLSTVPCTTARIPTSFLRMGGGFCGHPDALNRHIAGLVILPATPPPHGWCAPLPPPLRSGIYCGLVVVPVTWASDVLVEVTMAARCRTGYPYVRISRSNLSTTFIASNNSQISLSRHPRGISSTWGTAIWSTITAGHTHQKLINLLCDNVTQPPSHPAHTHQFNPSPNIVLARPPV